MALSIQLVAVSPEIAVLIGSGHVSLVTADAPAKPGDLLTIYLAGLGVTDRAVATGDASPATTMVRPLVSPTLTLNGGTIPLGFAGSRPSQNELTGTAFCRSRRRAILELSH